jgi:tRNA pseudouridine38-40 synthase
MNKGAEVIMEYNDFTSFSKLHSDVKSYLCTIKSACWTQEGDHLIFTITADRFLRNMVRAIVGTLIDLGRHKIDLNHLRTIIEAKSRSFAGESAPSRGLFLHHISIPIPCNSIDV